MISFTPRLDAYDQMQDRPLGTNTGLYRNNALEGLTRDYKRQQDDYNFARRILKDSARRGDTQAALGLIGLGDKARADGVDFGGIQRYDTNQATVQGRLATQQQDIVDNNLGRQANRTLLERVIAGRDPVNPNATVGAGRGLSLQLPAQPMQRNDTSPATDPVLGTAIPKTQLGNQAFSALDQRGGDDLSFRQGLDRAIGVAKSPAEMQDLENAANEAGISSEDFNRRKNWWANRR